MGTYAIALHVPDELALRGLHNKLTLAGFKSHLIIESDVPYTGQAMALGLDPQDRAPLKCFLSKYPLIK